MPERIDTRLSALPPEFTLRAVPYLGILAVSVGLSVIMTFAPVWQSEPSQPDWLWLLPSFVIVGSVWAILVLRYRSIRRSADAQVSSRGGLAVLLSAVAFSQTLSPQGLIAGANHEVGSGWLWIGDSTLAIAGRGPDGPCTAEYTQIAGVGEVHVLGGKFTEPHLAIWFSDGTVVKATPTRYGLRSLLPFGRRRLRALTAALERLTRSA